MSTLPRLAAFLCIAAVYGCAPGDEPTPTGPVLVQQGRGPVVQSATGAGHFTQAGELRTFSFTAHRHADGTVQGEYQLHRRFAPPVADVVIHGDVTCLTVMGNTARIGGRQRNSSDEVAIPPGLENGFRVVDNGEGANDPPDLMSLMYFNAPPGFAQAYCAGAVPDPAAFPIESGNIQVRD